MLTEAERLPLAEGVNVTLMVQLAPAATELPHVFVCAKLLPLVPLTVRLVIRKAALPVLLSMTVRAVLVLLTGWLPKPRLVGERLTAGVRVL
jgi:O-antigen ligase